MKRALILFSVAIMGLLLFMLPAMAEIQGRLEPKDMMEIMMMTRQEILLSFGDNYISKDGEGWQRYYYPELGYTFVFEAAADGDTPLRFIDVDDGIVFDGLYGGMNWQQVIDRVGDRIIILDKGSASLGDDPALFRQSYTYDCLENSDSETLPCLVNIASDWSSENSLSPKTHLWLSSYAIWSPHRFYNPQGGQYYHSSDYCNAVSSRFLPLTVITCYNADLMNALTPCPYCIGKEDWAVSNSFYSGTDGAGTKALVQKVVDKFTKITVHAPENSAVYGWRLYIKGEPRATAVKIVDGLYTAWFVGNHVYQPAQLVPVDEDGAENKEAAIILQKGW